MKKIIKVFHPNWDNSIFCKKALSKYPNHILEVHTGTKFDIEKDKQNLTDGVELVILFPFWWYNPPGNFKLWIDKLFGDGKVNFTKSIISLHTTVGGGQKRYEENEEYNIERLLNNVSMSFEYMKIQYDGLTVDYDCIPTKGNK